MTLLGESTGTGIGRVVKTFVIVATLSLAVPMVPAAAAPWDQDQKALSARPRSESPSSPSLVPELSSETSTTTQNADGSFTVRASLTTVHDRNSVGELSEIDASWDALPEGRFAAEATASSLDTTIPEDASRTPIVVRDGGSWLSLKMHGLDGAPRIDGNDAVYETTDDADSVTYQVTDSGVKEEIVLDRKPELAPVYSYSLRTSADLSAELNPGGGIQILRGDGTIAFLIPRGNMIDSAPIPSYSENVSFELQGGAGAWRLKMTPDHDWLSDQERVYPVTIDPSVQENSRDCTIQSDARNASSCGSPFIRAGVKNGNKHRALLDFDLSSVPESAEISDPKLRLYLDASQTEGWAQASYFLSSPRKRWGSATWNNSGEEGAWSGGEPGQVLGISNTFSISSPTGWKVLDVDESALGDMISDKSLWRGLLISQRGELSANLLSFYGAGAAGSHAGKKPELSFTYTLASPNIPMDVRTLDGDLMSARVSHPRNIPVRAQFQIMDLENRSSILWSGISAPVASGARASVMPPYELLASPARYAVVVRAVDSLNHQSMLSRTFLVRDPDAVALAEAEKIALSIYASDQAAWDSGSPSPVVAAAAQRATSRLVSSGVDHDFAVERIAEAQGLFEQRADWVSADRSLVTGEGGQAIDSTEVSAKVVASGFDGPDSAFVDVSVRISQETTDVSTLDGDMYENPDGSLTPIDDPADPDYTDESHTQAQWSIPYTVHFDVVTRYVNDSGGNPRVSWRTPTLVRSNVGPIEDDQPAAPEVSAPPAESASVLAPGALLRGAVRGEPRDADAVTFYKGKKAAKYARLWTNADHDGNNQVDPNYVLGLDQNCANFVSAALHQGGMAELRGVSSLTSEVSYWSWRSVWLEHPHAEGPSTQSWTVASKLYLHLRNHRHAEWLRKLYNGVKGDVLFWDWEGDMKINHVNIVSGRTKSGMPRISQKTSNRHNMLLNVWLRNLVYPQNPNAKVWGFHHYTT
jgi:hypothetical protein